MINRSAVVFAYHDVGVRCLSVLLAAGVDVKLVVTHSDNRDEKIWWRSVSELAARENIPVMTPDDPNQLDVVERVAQCRPDLLFSFYYRQLLKEPLLNIPGAGAFNMHGSLLPNYRGRVPVNWAIVNGERETGASLHRMELVPDAGALVDQQPVAILPNDTALTVFGKVACAAEQVLQRSLPTLLSGTQSERKLDLAKGRYFGRRTPDDGCIDWSKSAWEIHNLIRAVAPPYPGAFSVQGTYRLDVMGSYWRGEPARSIGPRLYWLADRCYVDCIDGKRFEVIRLELNGSALTSERFATLFGSELKLISHSN